MKLSSQQKVCAQHLIQNKTYQEISDDMGLSKRTVEYYVELIKKKLDCHKKRGLIEKLKKLNEC